jgi:hypothetical protein
MLMADWLDDLHQQNEWLPLLLGIAITVICAGVAVLEKWVKEDREKERKERTDESRNRVGRWRASNRLRRLITKTSLKAVLREALSVGTFGVELCAG